jgi:glycosyltransferase involved in cell wall biosynthesis
VKQHGGSAISVPAAEAPHVLHVGSGFRPLRWGGLVAYVEDLGAEQLRQGWRVSYFFSGRYYRHRRKPRLKRWIRDDIEMREVVNSPLHDHGRQPELEISEPGVEAMFEAVLEELRPDVVHVQELAGLPFSLLEVARRKGVPVVMTLQDYFPLCSTFKLLDAAGQVCLRRDIGVDCRASVRADMRRPSIMFESTVSYELARRSMIGDPPHNPVEKLVGLLARPRLAAPPAARRTPLAAPETFQRRRDLNLKRLNGVDRLIAMSGRVAEIYALLGVEKERLTTMQLTLAHIERLSLRCREPGDPLTFATLTGGESVAKGSAVLMQAARRLTDELGRGAFRLLVFGRCEAAFMATVAGLDAVELRGTYRPAQLDELLEEVDVGIMPSVWEEAYGYAGMEFIAKGIPVIANPLGGMRDYVFEGRTGWINRSATGQDLAETMRRVIRAPQTVEEVTRRTRELRDEMILPIAEHSEAVAGVYSEAGVRG